jgi:uncharacterized delta-60 repeat protein
MALVIGSSEGGGDSAVPTGGGDLIWAKHAGGSGTECCRGITTLSDNTIVVTGYFEGTAIFGAGEANQSVLTSAGSPDIFIARYNPDGTLVWAKRAGGIDWDDSNGATTLSDNSIVVTGTFRGTATFGEGEANQEVLNSVGYDDIFVARYSPSGSLEWAKQAGGSAFDESNGITTLCDNSMVVTGSFNGTAIFGEGEPNQTVLIATDVKFDIFIARYNPDGSLAWANSAGGPSFDDGRGVTVLSDDSTVVTGYFNRTVSFGNGELNQEVLTSAGYSDIFIARYNPDGSLAWARRAGGLSSSDDGFGVTTLSDNSTVVTGCFIDATFGEGEPNQKVLTSNGDWDIFIARYNSDGTLAWVKRAGGASNEQGISVTGLSDNSTVVIGWFTGIAIFGESETNQTVLASGGDYDLFIASYDPDGTLVWAKCAGGSAFDRGYGVTALDNNSVVVCGTFSGTATMGSGELNETQLVSAGDDDIFIARFNP